MNAHELLTDDGQALLLLCSSLGMEEREGAAGPLKLSEWNQLARKIQSSRLERPGALPGLAAAELAEALEVPADEAERIARLLERGGRVALELDNLFARGMWVLTRADPKYPPRLKDRLKHQAPAVLFGAGEPRLFETPGIAVVGSRNVDEAAVAFAGALGQKIAAAGCTVVSGGARGTDRLAMDGGLQAGGATIGVLADSLERTIRQPDVRQLLLDDRLVLLTPYAPTAGFSVGAAMGRNKLIYGLSEFAVVVSSDFDKGGTWAGAMEAIKASWCPVFVRAAASAPQGNRELIKRGACELPETELPAITDLPAWLRAHVPPKAVEQDLFGPAPSA
jgi:predicted Rossmann fold nucleotide-binding protein DprA/Smf involved in DNA uptake